eukprot:Em0067g9a
MVLVVPGVKRNATVSLLNVLLDRVLTQPESIPASRISSSGNEMMLDSAEVYTGDEEPGDHDLLVVEQKAFMSLCSGLVQQCGCPSNPFGFVLNDHHSYYRLVHAFTCAGMLSRHYMNFCSFAGEVKQRNIHSGRR